MALCRLLEVNENRAKKKEYHNDMLRDILEISSKLVNRTVIRTEWLKNVPELWGVDLVDDARAKEYQESLES